MYRISFDRLEEIYAFCTRRLKPETATVEDMEAVDRVNDGESFGEWFDRIKPSLDVYEEE